MASGTVKVNEAHPLESVSNCGKKNAVSLKFVRNATPIAGAGAASILLCSSDANVASPT